VRNTTWDPGRFKAYIYAAAANVPELSSMRSIAKYIGLGNGGVSLLSKWFKGEERPSLDSLTKVAKLPGTDLVDLLRLTGRYGDVGENGEIPDPPSLRAINELARELDDMLAETSPLAPEDRERLHTVVDGVMNEHRRTMRAAQRKHTA
jgi:DNA-binding phage protein